MKRRNFLQHAFAATSAIGICGCSTAKSVRHTSEEFTNDALDSGLLGASRANYVMPTVVTEGLHIPHGSPVLPAIGDRKPVAYLEGAPVVAGARGPEAKPVVKTEYVIVQDTLTPPDVGKITDPFVGKPNLTGNKDPDVGLQLELAGFHVASGLKIGEKTRATMRITTTNNTGLTGSEQPLFWAFATGIDLYRQLKRPEQTKSNTTANTNSNLSDSVGGRPIQMPQGLGTFQIELIKHEEPPWWRQIFSFLASGKADVIIESLGYPAITKTALNLLDAFFTKLDNSRAETLLSSGFFPYAFSERGRAQYEKGANRIGVLNEGTWILVAPRDYDTLVKQKPYFYGSAGRLIPSGKSPLVFLAEVEDDSKKDPFANVTYAVFNARLSEAKFQ